MMSLDSILKYKRKTITFIIFLLVFSSSVSTLPLANQLIISNTLVSTPDYSNLFHSQNGLQPDYIGSKSTFTNEAKSFHISKYDNLMKWVSFFSRYQYDIGHIEEKVKVVNGECVELIIKLLETPLTNEISTFFSNYNVKNIKEHPKISCYTVLVHKNNLESYENNFLLDSYKVKGIEYVEPNVKIKSFFTPSDSYWYNQWNLEKINMPQAWDIERGSSSVRVAVLDGGIDYDHEDISSNYLDIGYDWVNLDGDPWDDDWDSHGTHCAGIIAATTDNSRGTAGIADISIFAEKVMDDVGVGYPTEIASGITHAVSSGADIISMSFGAEFFSQLIADAASSAISSGVILVAAAGNNGTSIPNYPAALDGVISVAATKNDDNIWSYSNYGSWIDISAPGVNILSTVSFDDYVYYSGTSMACPHVAGLAALIKSFEPSASADEIKQAIFESAVDLGSSGKDIHYGWGRINAYDALKLFCPDISVSMEDPVRAVVNDTLSLDIYLDNLGYKELTNVELKILVDGTITETAIIPSIASKAQFVYSFNITLSSSKIYFISALVSPLTDEIEILNNNSNTNIEVIDLNHYSMSISNFTWLNAKKFGKQLPLSGYRNNITVDLPFNFFFYDETHDKVSISTSGYITFSDVFPDISENIPTANKYIIAPCWDNELFCANNIYYWSTDDFFVIEFYDYKDTLSRARGTFEVVLFSNGDILFQYKSFTNTISSLIGINYAYSLNYYQIFDYNLVSNENFTLFFSLNSQRTEHDIVLGLVYPEYLLDCYDTTIYATVINIGTSHEFDVIFQMYFNSILVNNTVISEIQSGETYTLSHTIIPELANYNITIIVVPLANESFILSNKIIKILNTVRNYKIFNPAFNWIDTSGAINLNDRIINSGEICIDIDLPFTFIYYGTEFDKLYVSPQGWITFDNNQNFNYVPPHFPTAINHFMIAPCWRSMNIDSPAFPNNAAGISIKYASNYIVLNFIDFYTRFSDSYPADFQVVLFENGDILFQYENINIVNEFSIGVNFGIDTRYFTDFPFYEQNFPSVNGSIAFLFKATNEAAPPIPWPSYDDGKEEFEVLTSENTINWKIYDDDPLNYTIYVDGIFLQQGNWTSLSPITVEVICSVLGTFIYTLEITDRSGCTLILSKIISVINFPPQISGQPYFSILYKKSNYFLTWTAEDSNPSYYEIYQNSSLLVTANWTSLIPITFDISNVKPGRYLYEIIVFDLNGLYCSFVTILQVNSDITQPTINSPPDKTIGIHETHNSISWTAYDQNPWSYIIYKNDIIVSDNFWTNGVTIVYKIPSLEIGIYEIKIVVYDAVGNSVSDTVIIYVEITSETTITDETTGFEFYLMLFTTLALRKALTKRKKRKKFA